MHRIGSNAVCAAASTARGWALPVAWLTDAMPISAKSPPITKHGSQVWTCGAVPAMSGRPPS